MGSSFSPFPVRTSIALPTTAALGLYTRILESFRMWTSLWPSEIISMPSVKQTFGEAAMGLLGRQSSFLI